MSDVNFNFIEKKDDDKQFEDLNPSKQIPMILLHDDIKLLAGIREQMLYLAYKIPSINLKFLKNHDREVID